MFLVIKKKTPVSRNSVLEKVETQILPAWWLLIWGTQVEVLGILFPFCVFFFPFFYPTSYTLCTANLHPEQVRNTQDWWITYKAPSQAHSPKKRKCIFPPDLTWQRRNISREAWLTHGHLQKLIPRNKLSSCCHSRGSQQIPWSLHHHHTLDSSTWTPSTGWEQCPVSTHPCTKNHSWSSWHWGCTTSWLEWKHRSSGYLTKITFQGNEKV